MTSTFFPTKIDFINQFLMNKGSNNENYVPSKRSIKNIIKPFEPTL